MRKWNFTRSVYTFFMVFFLFVFNSIGSELKENDDLAIIANKANSLVFATTNKPQTKLYKKANLILTYAFAKLNYEFSLVNLPNKRNLLWANEEKIDGIAFRIASVAQHYPNLVRVEEPIFTIEHWVYSRKPINVDGWDSLSTYSIAYEQGSLFIEENMKSLSYLFPASSSESAFALVYKKRADLTITSKSTGDDIIAANQTLYQNKIKRQHPALIKTVMFSYLNKKHKQLATDLAQILKKMKASGEYQDLIAQIEYPFSILFLCIRVDYRQAI
ncbi:substrate-binding periplasmic protein [Thalassotalea piscium]